MSITITVADVKNITGSRAPLAAEMVPMINEWAPFFQVTSVKRMAGFLGQLSVESMFTYRGEIWEPTPAQKRYEMRKDLGNTRRGDGSKFRGYGGIQATGRANVTEFYEWCLAKLPAGTKIPDFRETPELLGKAPWWVIVSFWYWSTRDLNRLADKITLENVSATVKPITKKVNGGYNHLAERITATTRALRRLHPEETPIRRPQPLMGDAAAVLLTQGTVTGMGRVPEDAPHSMGVDSITGLITGMGGTGRQRKMLPQPKTITPEGIKVIQKLLFQKGYKSVGDADGVYGVDTRDAASGFRRDNNMPIAADLDGDGTISGDELLDAAFQQRLLSSEGRSVDPVRAELPALDIAKIVPEVMGARVSKLTALAGLVGGGVPAIGGGMMTILSGFQGWRDTVQPWMDSMSVEVRPWQWFLILFVLSGFSWWYARRAERKGIEAYRAGERVAQS